ncbi:MAG TPA: hypothetical protein VGD58_27415 [Herpetosiphonaceae bacterium]
MSLGLVLLLTACTGVDAPTPQMITAEAVQPWEHKLAWEGLIIQVPAQATFKPFPSVAAPATNGLPLIAAGAITYSSPAATTDGAEWYGPSLMLFRFAGSAAEWIDLERKASQPQAVGSPPRRVIEESIQPRTIAGKPGLAYQFAASPAIEQTMEQYAVKLTDEQLLVIVTQDTQNPTYQSVIDTLQPQP